MNGFTELDMVNYRFFFIKSNDLVFRYLIYSNIIQSVWQLIEGAKNLNIEIDVDAETDVEEFQRYHHGIHPADIELNEDITLIIKRIYKSAFIHKVLIRQHEIILL